MENYQFESVRCTVELVWILAIRWNMIVISAFSAAGGECEKHTRSQHQMSSVFSVHCTCVNGQLETSKWWYRNQKLTEKIANKNENICRNVHASNKVNTEPLRLFRWFFYVFRFIISFARIDWPAFNKQWPIKHFYKNISRFRFAPEYIQQPVS